MFFLIAKSKQSKFSKAPHKALDFGPWIFFTLTVAVTKLYQTYSKPLYLCFRRWGKNKEWHLIMLPILCRVERLPTLEEFSFLSGVANSQNPHYTTYQQVVRPILQVHLVKTSRPCNAHQPKIMIIWFFIILLTLLQTYSHLFFFFLCVGQ